MFDLVMYEFKYLNTGKVTPEDFFMDSYAEEINQLEKFRTSTKLLRNF